MDNRTHQIVVAPDGKRYSVPIARQAQKKPAGRGCLSNILCFIFLAALGGGIYYIYEYTDLLDRLTGLLDTGFDDSSPPGEVGVEIRGNNGTDFVGVIFTTNTSELEQAPYIAAAEYWSDVLRGQTINSPDQLGTFVPSVTPTTMDITSLCSPFSNLDQSFVFEPNTLMDHVIIAVQITNLASGILGAAKPCKLHDNGADDLPVLGGSVYNKDIFTNAANQAAYFSTAYETARHEFGHVLGIGTLWRSKGLITDTVFDALGNVANANNLPKYGSGGTGPGGLEGYQDLDSDGSADFDTFVPVEDGKNGINGAGSYFSTSITPPSGGGSIDAHWKEANFGDELMTFAKTGQPYASMLTLKSLLDLGWTSVDTSFAEAATPNPGSCCSLRGSGPQWSVPLDFSNNGEGDVPVLGDLYAPGKGPKEGSSAT